MRDFRFERKAFTLVELLVVIAIIALLLSILMPSLGRARDQARTVVCLSNTKQLGLSWLLYAEDSKGRIVNGCAGKKIAPDSEDGWVDWAGYASLTDAEKKAQTAAIKNGLLWSYVNNLAIYRCPASTRDLMRTYNPIAGMNATPWRDPSKQWQIVKNLNQIKKPASRVVYLCDKILRDRGWIMYYALEGWWDLPTINHQNGMAMSFADGHSEHWKWQDPRTIKYAKSGILTGEVQINNPDIRRMAMACFGEIGFSRP